MLFSSIIRLDKYPLRLQKTIRCHALSIRFNACFTHLRRIQRRYSLQRDTYDYDTPIRPRSLSKAELEKLYKDHDNIFQTMLGSYSSSLEEGSDKTSSKAVPEKHRKKRRYLGAEDIAKESIELGMVNQARNNNDDNLKRILRFIHANDIKNINWHLVVLEYTAMEKHDKALGFLSLLPEYGIHPNNDDILKLIGVLVDKGNVSGALSLYNVLEKKDISVDKFNHMLQKASKYKPFSMLGELVYKDMQDLNQVNNTTRNQMIVIYSRAKKIDEAYEILQGMIDNHEFISTTTFCIYLKSLGECSDVAEYEAERIFYIMHRKNIPDTNAVGALLKIFSLKGSVEKAVHLVGFVPYQLDPQCIYLIFKTFYIANRTLHGIDFVYEYLQTCESAKFHKNWNIMIRDVCLLDSFEKYECLFRMEQLRRFMNEHVSVQYFLKYLDALYLIMRDKYLDEWRQKLKGTKHFKPEYEEVWGHSVKYWNKKLMEHKQRMINQQKDPNSEMLILKNGEYVQPRVKIKHWKPEIAVDEEETTVTDAYEKDEYNFKMEEEEYKF